MSVVMSISIADKVASEIEGIVRKEKISNKSEFVEELIRCGLLYHNPKK